MIICMYKPHNLRTQDSSRKLTRWLKMKYWRITSSTSSLLSASTAWQDMMCQSSLPGMINFLQKMTQWPKLLSLKIRQVPIRFQRPNPKTSTTTLQIRLDCRPCTTRACSSRFRLLTTLSRQLMSSTHLRTQLRIRKSSKRKGTFKLPNLAEIGRSLRLSSWGKPLWTTSDAWIELGTTSIRLPSKNPKRVVLHWN